MNNRIRVLHIIKSLGRGGAEMLLAETLKLHDQDQFEFHYIYFLPWKDQMVEALRNGGGKVTCLRASNNIKLITKFGEVERYLADNRIQLIHAHLPWAGLVARIVGSRTGVPVIYTEHNKQERYHGITRFLNLKTMNMLNHIVAVSDEVASSIKNNKQSLKTPVQTIPNGVDTRRFQRNESSGISLRQQLKINPKAPVIGTVAVFRTQKRLDVWLQAASKILEKAPDTRFIIVGDGPLKEMLHSAAASVPGDAIRFVGLQTDVIPYLSAMDIFMMTSIFEGMPVALLEAMSCECAIVATKAGGTAEVVRDNIDGLLCDVETPMEVVPMALSLLNDPEKRLALGRAARARVQENFAMKTMVAELEDMYRSFVKV